MQGNLATLIVALLGAIKLVLEVFGISLLDNQQIDAIANGIAALVAVVGVVINHFRKQPQPPSNGDI